MTSATPVTTAPLVTTRRPGTGLATTVVIATRNRAGELLATLDRLCALEERPAIVVVDNASTDGTPDAVAACHPCAEIVPLAGNAGAAARTIGARRARTPLVAFADDDSWWASGSLQRAATLFAARSRLGLVAGRVVVEPSGVTDPTCEAMARSPLGPLPGTSPPAGLPQVLGFLACGAVVRRDAFLGAGGFRPELLVGGEEALLAIDLAVAGWEQVYAPDVVAHHRPSPRRDPAERRRREVRNALWVAWARRRAAAAVPRSLDVLRHAGPEVSTVKGVADALAGVRWVAHHRSVVPRSVEAALATLEERGR